MYMAVERLRRGELNSAVLLKTATHDKSKKHGSLSVSIPLGVPTPARTMRARLTHSQLPSLVLLALAIFPSVVHERQVEDFALADFACVSGALNHNIPHGLLRCARHLVSE
jgi:hypothetical protein